MAVLTMRFWLHQTTQFSYYSRQNKVELVKSWKITSFNSAIFSESATRVVAEDCSFLPAAVWEDFYK